MIHALHFTQITFLHKPLTHNKSYREQGLSVAFSIKKAEVVKNLCFFVYLICDLCLAHAVTSAVDKVVCTSDERCLVRKKIEHKAYDLLRLSCTADECLHVCHSSTCENGAGRYCNNSDAVRCSVLSK